MNETIHLSEDYLVQAEGELPSEKDKADCRELAESLLKSGNGQPVSLILDHEQLEADGFESPHGWIIVPKNLKFIAFARNGKVESIVPLE